MKREDCKKGIAEILRRGSKVECELCALFTPNQLVSLYPTGWLCPAPYDLKGDDISDWTWHFEGSMYEVILSQFQGPRGPCWELRISNTFDSYSGFSVVGVDLFTLLHRNTYARG